MGKKGKNRIGVVYSTNEDYNYSYENDEQETLPIDEQELTAHLEKKGRGGKEAVLVKGFVGTSEDINRLAKLLKQQCGVGGSAKEGEIIIQGNNRDRVMEVLTKLGYHVKRVGG